MLLYHILLYHIFMNHINILFMNHNNEPYINVSHAFIFPQTVSAQTSTAPAGLFRDPHDRLKSNSRLDYNR